jgi:RNA polymerase sigma-70 factor (ECF subfamily)
MDGDMTSPDQRFEALFRHNSRAVLAYALRRTDDAADAADVVAETFLVAWRRIDDVPADPDGRMWLFGVARRSLGNHRRSLGRRSALGERLRAQLQDVVLPDPTGDIDDAHMVAAAMATLSEDDAEILRLTNWEAIAPAEIAIVLGLPAATVRTRLHRARARLREQLQLPTRGTTNERQRA